MGLTKDCGIFESLVVWNFLDCGSGRIPGGVQDPSQKQIPGGLRTKKDRCRCRNERRFRWTAAANADVVTKAT